MATVQTSTGLALLLGDFDAERFFAEHWDRRSLYLAHDDPARFAHLISHESFFEQEIHRAVHLKASARDPGGWNREVRIQPAQAYKLFQLGMTICATSLDERGPVGELIAAYRADITTAISPHVNCYYSPNDGGYGLHFDTHPVWIVQVAGRKEWTFSFAPAVRDPLFSVVFPPERDRVELPWITIDRPRVDDPERFTTVCLEPGHVLYLPAGCWHAARAAGSSLALTLAVEQTTTTDLFAAFMRRVPPASLPATRLAPFPNHARTRAEARAGVLKQIAGDLDVLKTLVNSLDAEQLLGVYQHLAEHHQTNAKRGFADATAQVKIMREQYGRPGEGRPPQD